MRQVDADDHRVIALEKREALPELVPILVAFGALLLSSAIALCSGLTLGIRAVRAIAARCRTVCRGLARARSADLLKERVPLLGRQAPEHLLLFGRRCLRGDRNGSKQNDRTLNEEQRGQEEATDRSHQNPWHEGPKPGRATQIGRDDTRPPVLAPIFCAGASVHAILLQ